MTDADERMEATVGSGNVFADLGFEDPETELAKADIALAILREIEARKLTQARAARMLAIDQSRVSLIVRGRTEGFSLERLVELAQKVNLHVASRRSRSASQIPINVTVQP